MSVSVNGMLGTVLLGHLHLPLPHWYHLSLSTLTICASSFTDHQLELRTSLNLVWSLHFNSLLTAIV